MPKFEIAGWKLHVFGLGKKTLRTCSEKVFFYGKKYNRKSIFCKTFFCSLSIYLLLQSLLSKLLIPPSADKKNLFTLNRLKDVHNWCSLIHPFLANYYSTFFCSRSFANALDSDKCQIESFEDINILIKVKLFCLKNVFFEKKLSFEKKLCFWKHKLKKNAFFQKKLLEKITFF